MTVRILVIAGVLAAAAAFAQAAEGAPGEIQGIAVDPPIAASDAFAFWRWIGVRTNPDIACPDAAGWSATPLFGLGALPPGLAPYCKYEFPEGMTVTPGAVSALQALVTAGMLARVDADIMGLTVQGSELSDRSWELLQEHFLAQAGQPVAPVWGGIDLVRLAVIDTQSTGDIDPQLDANYNASHGFDLLNMAEALLCGGPGGTCAAAITSQLALAYTCFDRRVREDDPPGRDCRDADKGGWMGLLGDLAVAVRNEVVDWETDTPPPPPGDPQTHLVLNLSIGWHPRLGGTQQNPANMTASAAAVYSALEDAVCRGALVIAAAGNETSGPDDVGGPLYPGGWEQRRAPGRGRCQNLIERQPPGYAFPPPGAPDRRSLVYAAGGVRSAGSKLYNTPPGGEPRLVAYADHAAVDATALAGPTATLTGTSVAAAVVSSAAAAAWHFRNNARTFAVINGIHSAGTPLGRLAEFCQRGTPGNPCPASLPVHQVAVCTVSPALVCPLVQPLDFSGVFLDDFTVEADLAELTASLQEPVCGAVTVFYDPAAGVPANPCPQEQFHGVTAQPWTAPQPESTPCPNCSNRYMSPGTLYFEVDASFSGPVTDATLQCGSNVYSLDLGPLNPGDRGAIANADCAGAEPVTLYFVDADGNTMVTPVLNLD